jgi:hypothetical protein
MGVYVLNSFEYAPPQIPMGVPIPKLYGFMFSLGCTRRDRGSSPCPALQSNLYLNGGISPGVENLARDNVNDA